MTETSAPAGKIDPEALAIRARPPRAIRFKRGAIVALAASASAGLMVVTWIALRPGLVPHAGTQTEASEPNQIPPEALKQVPASYAQVPQLGPPLPGDLGRPILEHEQSLASPVTVSGEAGEQARMTSRDQQLAELKAARRSSLLVQRASPPVADPQSAAPAAADPSDSSAPTLSRAPERDSNGQGRKAAFIAAPNSSGEINPHLLRRSPSPYTLSAGSVIAASLITGLRSDLPGLVTAQVTENVFDSATGRILLVPQGARLIGIYDSVVAFGQKRALIVWQRIILPDGSSLTLDNAPATDAAGYAGLADKVDAHTWQLLKGIALSTLLGVSSQLALSGQSDLVQAIRTSTQDSAARAGDQIVRADLGVQPTVTVRPGAPVRLVVHKDLILAPWHS